LDERSNTKGAAVFKGHSGGQNAAHGWQLSGAALAHIGRVAFMLYGNARVTVLNPDGTIFIGDVAKATFGTFQQDSLTQSKGWDRMVLNLC